MGEIKHRAVGEEDWTSTDVGDRPMTVICHQGDMRIKPTDQIPINPEITVYHGQRVVKIDPVGRAWAEYILGYELENLAPSDRDLSEAHVIGLCDLPIKLMQKCRKPLSFFIKEPETYLHPSQQCRIADWASTFSVNISDDGVFDKLPSRSLND